MGRKAAAKQQPTSILADYGDLKRAGIDPRTKAVAWRYVHCAKHHFDGYCECPPGPQELALSIPGSVCREIALGGGRGSIKSETGLGWLTMGNYWPKIRPLVEGNRFGLPAGHIHPYDISYLNNPHFKFLVLRKTTKDLADWLLRALEVLKPFGVEKKGDPDRLEFPSGAVGFIGHWEDDAWKKWQGQEVVKLLWEEAGQIPSEEIYLKIIASVRTPHKEMDRQIMLTINPGDVGNQWINARFRYDENGNRREHGKVFKDKDGNTRIFIHSTVYDNPFYTTYKNGERVLGVDDYATDLENKYASSEFLYKTWVLGDFDCVQGSYFTEFRKTRMSDEPEWAYHVIEPREDGTFPVQLAYWWPRAIGLDWGYAHPTAVVWGCWHPEGRLYVYRELSLDKVSAAEIGATVAKYSLPELEKLPDHHMTIYASHDAFWRKDENATVDLIKSGIDSVLGRGAAFIHWPDLLEQSLPTGEAFERVRERWDKESDRVAISIIRANPDRIGGWSVIRDLLRWKKIAPDQVAIDEAYCAQLRATKGVLAEREYRAAVEAQRKDEEVLPKIRFLGCPATVRSLMGLIHDEKRVEDALKSDGDDPADALRYLCIEFQQKEGAKPKEVWLHDEAQRIFSQYGNVSDTARYWAMQNLQAKYDKAHRGSVGITIPRMAGRRARLMRRYA